MKKIIYTLVIALSFWTITSCDSMFDTLEGDLTKMTAEDMLSSEAGIKRILANLYGDMPFTAFAKETSTMHANASRSSQSYGTSGVSTFWNYTKIRSINKFLVSLDDAYSKGTLGETSYNTFKGEAMFIRAYCYFASVRKYGGIPIVTEPLDEYFDGGENAGLYIPRKTEKETWDWVLDQFEQAAELLPETQSDEMRITKYTAYGMLTRASLWAASTSKYWDRMAIDSDYAAVQKGLTYMDASYADAYYKKAIEAGAKVINSGKYALYGADPASVSNAVDNLAELFLHWKSEEGLLGKSYVTGSTTTGTGIETSWIPSDTWLSGNYSVTLNCADIYDDYVSDKDRRHVHTGIVTKVNGDEDYYWTGVANDFKYSNVSEYVHYPALESPFKNKDARFQAWVIYPGCTWRGMYCYIQGGLIKADKEVSIMPSLNTEYEYNGTTYYPFGQYGDVWQSNMGFYKMNGDLNDNKRTDWGFFVRKYMDLNTQNQYNQSPWYDLRYAEVLLSYAEAVVESGYGDKTLAAKCLNDVRHRAGFTDDIDLTLENVLHEFKAEFMFENVWSSVLWRHRAFYNEEVDNPLEGESGMKLALLPVLDLSSGEPSYIFLRTVNYFTEPERYSGNINIPASSYYLDIPNYQDNHIDPNNR